MKYLALFGFSGILCFVFTPSTTTTTAETSAHPIVVKIDAPTEEAH